MTRRRFAFWIGMGLFGLAERLNAEGLDTLAAAVMEAAGPPAAPPSAPIAEAAAPTEMPVHWQTTHNRTWRWVQREHYVDGEWRLTGMTTPVRIETGEPLADAEGYLDESDVPEAFLSDAKTESKPADSAEDFILDESLDYESSDDEFWDEEPLIEPIDHGVSTAEDQPGPDATAPRRARHGRPPSRWLRSLTADELSVWLATLEPPEAGVSGMTFFMHLTRDHGFDTEPIEGLTEAEQEKLHGAAHHGY